MRQNLPQSPARPARERAFTLIEVVAVLVILGILGAVVAPKAARPGLAAPRAAEVASQLRYLQLRALKDRTAAWGMSCDGTNYWGFNGTDPASAANRVALPGESGSLVALADKGIAMGAFTVIFDQYGIPYSPDAATKLTANAVISVTETGNGATITITPETGFIP